MPPQFFATARLSIIGRVQGTDPTAVEEQLELLCEQIESAILTNQALLQSVNQFSFVDTDMGVTADGRQHIGEVQMDFGMEYNDDFDPFVQAPAALPPIAVPLMEVGAHVDLTNVFDPEGTYPNPPFPGAVTPAPRTAGPDGRDEGYIQFNLPQS